MCYLGSGFPFVSKVTFELELKTIVPSNLPYSIFLIPFNGVDETHVLRNVSSVVDGGGGCWEAVLEYACVGLFCELGLEPMFTKPQVQFSHWQDTS